LDNKQSDNHLPYYDAKEYWGKRAKRYGSSYEGWKAVCVIGEWEYKNNYLDMLQRRAVFNTIREWRGKNVLDLGCGVGRFALEFARRGAYVTGIDISEEMIKIAKDNFKRAGLSAQFYVAGIDEMPLLDESFDIVTSITVLQHVTDPDMFLRSARSMLRVTKSHGQILLLEYAPTTPARFPTDTHMAGRSCSEYVATFEGLGAVLTEKRGVMIMKLDDWLTKTVHILRSQHGADRRVHEIKRTSTSKIFRLYRISRKFLIKLSMPFDIHLSPLPLFRNLSDLKLLLFQKEVE